MWVGAEVEAWWGGEWYEARMVAELDGRSQQGAAVLIHYVGGRRARCLPFSPHPHLPSARIFILERLIFLGAPPRNGPTPACSATDASRRRSSGSRPAAPACARR